MGGPVRDLTAALAALLETTQHLHDRLLDEQAALRESDAQRIQTLSDEKARLWERTESILKVLRRVTGASRTDDPDRALRTFFAEQPPSPATETWSAILDLARRCRDLNEANGALIQGALRQTHEALRILLGEADETYAPGIGSRPQFGSRSYGKA